PDAREAGWERIAPTAGARGAFEDFVRLPAPQIENAIRYQSARPENAAGLPPFTPGGGPGDHHPIPARKASGSQSPAS
ncbi:MAG: hypothetical protein NZ765_13520, partial [Anaerolineae bacterium]|nr:hypothetical protein [Anaerolineae bacterium]